MYICIRIGHQDRPVSETNADSELQVEEAYEYDYIIVPPPPHVHVAHANQSGRAEESNISLSTNISYNVVI